VFKIRVPLAKKTLPKNGPVIRFNPLSVLPFERDKSLWLRVGILETPFDPSFGKGCLISKEIILFWAELFKITGPYSDFDLKMIVRSLVNSSLIQNFTLLQGILKWEVSLYC
jgi:hypothetical protein